MPSIELIETETDDPHFVALVNSFISHYADSGHPKIVKVIHIDSWFGERWLGFAGKFRGIAGIRNRSLYTRLPAPPFIPSRVISAYDFHLNHDESYTRYVGEFRTIHTYKNGGVVWHLHRPGLYCWYSGNTVSNTTASLMIYEVTREGNNAWYVSFDMRGKWDFTKCRNVSPEECAKIVSAHRNGGGRQ
jgi:hypothetical protein